MFYEKPIGKLSFKNRVFIYLKNDLSYYLLLIILILSIVVILKSNNVDFKSAYYLNFNTKTAKGEIIDVFNTDKYQLTTITHINNSEESTSLATREFFGYEYVYEVDNKLYRWTSYSYNLNRLKVGDIVEIEYNINHPEFSRITNFTNSPGIFSFSIYSGILLLFIIFFLLNLRSGFRFYKKIQKGFFVKAFLKEDTIENDFPELKQIFEQLGETLKTDNLPNTKQITNIEVNYDIPDNPTYKLTYSYKFDGQQFQKIFKTDFKLIRSKLTDEYYELLIHFPHSSEEAILVDSKNNVTAKALKKVAKEQYNI
ncbi:DUF3592 domain-containing protein [Aureivirga marina]|uniref:DUF3592 domain-containing protein n=1 Tax=Aureivirga marina TaxID=1182451 RepID=UPI0018C9CFC3|nr:DUF3592 domain-containing protein [Aureivirga marina]